MRYLFSRRLRFCTRRLCNPQAASIAASETPSFVFRNTSFTMRQRFTPESACSTLTRMRANLRFVRFSAVLSSPRGGFFFRLASFLDRRVIPLEAGILVQDCLRRIGNCFRIGNLLIVRLANACVAQEVNAFPRQGHDDDVLVGVRPLLAAVVLGL